MPKAIISISDEANRTIIIVKANYGLRDKSEAINTMAEQYENNLMEPELRPEYVKKLKKILKEGKYIGPFKSVEELDKHIRSNA